MFSSFTSSLGLLYARTTTAADVEEDNDWKNDNSTNSGNKMNNNDTALQEKAASHARTTKSSSFWTMMTPQAMLASYLAQALRDYVQLPDGDCLETRLLSSSSNAGFILRNVALQPQVLWKVQQNNSNNNKNDDNDDTVVLMLKGSLQTIDFSWTWDRQVYLSNVQVTLEGVRLHLCLEGGRQDEPENNKQDDNKTEQQSSSSPTSSDWMARHIQQIVNHLTLRLVDVQITVDLVGTGDNHEDDNADDNHEDEPIGDGLSDTLVAELAFLELATVTAGSSNSASTTDNTTAPLQQELTVRGLAAHVARGQLPLLDGVDGTAHIERVSGRRFARNIATGLVIQGQLLLSPRLHVQRTTLERLWNSWRAIMPDNNSATAAVSHDNDFATVWEISLPRLSLVLEGRSWELEDSVLVYRSDGSECQWQTRGGLRSAVNNVRVAPWTLDLVQSSLLFHHHRAKHSSDDDEATTTDMVWVDLSTKELAWWQHRMQEYWQMWTTAVTTSFSSDETEHPADHDDDNDDWSLDMPGSILLRLHDTSSTTSQQPQVWMECKIQSLSATTSSSSGQVLQWAGWTFQSSHGISVQGPAGQHQHPVVSFFDATEIRLPSLEALEPLCKFGHDLVASPPPMQEAIAPTSGNLRVEIPQLQATLVAEDEDRLTTFLHVSQTAIDVANKIATVRSVLLENWREAASRVQMENVRMDMEQGTAVCRVAGVSVPSIGTLLKPIEQVKVQFQANSETLAIECSTLHANYTVDLGPTKASHNTFDHFDLPCNSLKVKIREIVLSPQDKARLDLPMLGCQNLHASLTNVAAPKKEVFVTVKSHVIKASLPPAGSKMVLLHQPSLEVGLCKSNAGGPFSSQALRIVQSSAIRVPKLQVMLNGFDVNVSDLQQWYDCDSLACRFQFGSLHESNAKVAGNFTADLDFQNYVTMSTFDEQTDEDIELNLQPRLLRQVATAFQSTGSRDADPLENGGKEWKLSIHSAILRLELDRDRWISSKVANLNCRIANDNVSSLECGSLQLRAWNQACILFPEIEVTSDFNLRFSSTIEVRLDKMDNFDELWGGVLELQEMMPTTNADSLQHADCIAYDRGVFLPEVWIQIGGSSGFNASATKVFAKINKTQNGTQKSELTIQDLVVSPTNQHIPTGSGQHVAAVVNKSDNEVCASLNFSHLQVSVPEMTASVCDPSMSVRLGKKPPIKTKLPLDREVPGLGFLLASDIEIKNVSTAGCGVNLELDGLTFWYDASKGYSGMQVSNIKESEAIIIRSMAMEGNLLDGVISLIQSANSNDKSISITLNEDLIRRVVLARSNSIPSNTDGVEGMDWSGWTMEVQETAELQMNLSGQRWVSFGADSLQFHIHDGHWSAQLRHGTARTWNGAHATIPLLGATDSAAGITTQGLINIFLQNLDHVQQLNNMTEEISQIIFPPLSDPVPLTPRKRTSVFESTGGVMVTIDGENGGVLLLETFKGSVASMDVSRIRIQGFAHRSLEVNVLDAKLMKEGADIALAGKIVEACAPGLGVTKVEIGDLAMSVEGALLSLNADGLKVFLSNKFDNNSAGGEQPIKLPYDVRIEIHEAHVYVRELSGTVAELQTRQLCAFGSRLATKSLGRIRGSCDTVQVSSFLSTTVKEITLQANFEDSRWESKQNNFLQVPGIGRIVSFAVTAGHVPVFSAPLQGKLATPCRNLELKMANEILEVSIPQLVWISSSETAPTAQNVGPQPFALPFSARIEIGEAVLNPEIDGVVDGRGSSSTSCKNLFIQLDPMEHFSIKLRVGAIDVRDTALYIVPSLEANAVVDTRNLELLQDVNIVVPSILTDFTSSQWKNRDDSSKDKVISLPNASVSSTVLTLSYKGKLLSIDEATIKIPAFSGDPYTDSASITQYYTARVKKRIPYLLAKTNIVGTNVGDRASTAVGTLALNSTIVGGVAGVVARDAAGSLISAGKKARGAEASDRYQFGDVTRGLVSSLKSTAKSEAKLRGHDKYQVGDATTGTAKAASSYASQNRVRLSTAAGSSIGMVAGLALAGPVGLVAGSVVAGQAAGAAVEKAFGDPKKQKKAKSESSTRQSPGTMLNGEETGQTNRQIQSPPLQVFPPSHVVPLQQSRHSSNFQPMPQWTQMASGQDQTAMHLAVASSRQTPLQRHTTTEPCNQHSRTLHHTDAMGAQGTSQGPTQPSARQIYFPAQSYSFPPTDSQQYPSVTHSSRAPQQRGPTSYEPTPQTQLPTDTQLQQGYRFGDLTRSVISRGKEARGADNQSGYKFGDFTRGLFGK